MEKNTIASNQKKKKVYEFALLQKRSSYMRMDFYIVGFESAFMFYYFGGRLFDVEDLMGIGMMILSIVFNGVLLLLNFWSIPIHEFFAYSTLEAARIDICTDVRVKIDN